MTGRPTARIETSSACQTPPGSTVSPAETEGGEINLAVFVFLLRSVPQVMPSQHRQCRAQLRKAHWC